MTQTESGDAAVTLPERAWRVVGLVLLGGTIVLLSIDAYEVYYLTIRDGPQMVYFTLLHGGRPYLLLFLAAVPLFYLHALYAVIILIMRLSGRIKRLDFRLRVSVAVLPVQVVHIILQANYYSWAYGLLDK